MNKRNKLRQTIAKRRKKSQAEQFKIKEGMTFVDYLLVELQLTDQDLRDPKKKQEIMRLMRSDDAAAQSIVKRAETKKVRADRAAVQQEEDPRKAALRRKRIMLMKQVNQIDSELNAQTLDQQQQAQQPSQSKM